MLSKTILILLYGTREMKRELFNPHDNCFFLSLLLSFKLIYKHNHRHLAPLASKIDDRRIPNKSNIHQHDNLPIWKFLSNSTTFDDRL